MDFSTLELQRLHHPAWKLLRSDHAALVASFLVRSFVVPNIRFIAESELAEALEDELFRLRERNGAESFPKSALEYIRDWASDEKGWLRRFYMSGSDEPQIDLTPSTEKVIAWLSSLTERTFVGTESSLLTLFELLRQMTEGTETDVEVRLAELERRREEIDLEIQRVQAGDFSPLDATGQKDRFQQFTSIARDLLSDFREVEHNFRGLDRRVRERIALWAGSKGELLEEIMGDRDAISDSDQGRSFRAFWDFLMSSSRQEELTQLLDRVLALPAIIELRPDPRTRRVHYDWLSAGEHTQRMVAQLSHQLRRFLDDRAWLENRRSMDILRGIETRALAVRNDPPSESLMSMPGMSAEIALPMERKLFTPPIVSLISNNSLESGEVKLDTAALFSHVVIDKARLARQIRYALHADPHVTLKTLCDLHPLEHGLAELVAYLHLGSETFHTIVDEEMHDVIQWRVEDSVEGEASRRATMAQVIFVRDLR